MAPLEELEAESLLVPLDLEDEVEIKGGVHFIDLKYLHYMECCIEYDGFDYSTLEAHGSFRRLIPFWNVHERAVSLVISVGETHQELTFIFNQKEMKKKCISWINYSKELKPRFSQFWIYLLVEQSEKSLQTSSESIQVPSPQQKVPGCFTSKGR